MNNYKVVDEFFTCNCESNEHILRISINDYNSDEPELQHIDDVVLTVAVHLSQYLSLYQRVVHAFKYICGYKCKFGDFDCADIKAEDVPRLRKLLDKFEETRGKYVKQSI